MAKAVLTISSKNYGAWALRGWLLAKLAGLDFTEKVISTCQSARPPPRIANASWSCLP